MVVTEKNMEMVAKLRAGDATLIGDAATEIERLRQGGEILRGELNKARHDLMARETVKDERIANVEAAGHRLALELECLLLDTKDLPTVSKWWDSGMTALEEWSALHEYNGPRLGD